MAAHPRLSLHQVAFADETPAQFARRCRQLGVGNLTLAAPLLRDPAALDDLRAELAKGDLRVATLNQPFARFPDLERDDGTAAARMNETIDLAAELGAGAIYLITGGRGALDWEAGAARFAELIAPCRARTERQGIALLVENANAFNADIHMAHTLADTLLLARSAGIGVCIDLMHCWAEAGLARLFADALPLTGLVQVSDYVLGDRVTPGRAVPGDGEIPLERLIGQLLDGGYAGLFDIELIGPRIAAEGALAAATRAVETVSAMLNRLGA